MPRVLSNQATLAVVLLTQDGRARRVAAQDVAACRKPPSSAPSPASEAYCVPCTVGGSGPWLTRHSKPLISATKT